MRIKSEPGLGITGLKMASSHLTAVHHAPFLYTTSKTLRADLPAELGQWAASTVASAKPIDGFYYHWSKGQELEGYNMSFGPLFNSNDSQRYDETQFCPEHHKVCGFSYRANAKSGMNFSKHTVQYIKVF